MPAARTGKQSSDEPVLAALRDAGAMYDQYLEVVTMAAMNALLDPEAERLPPPHTGAPLTLEFGS